VGARVPACPGIDDLVCIGHFLAQLITVASSVIGDRSHAYAGVGFIRGAYIAWGAARAVHCVHVAIPIDGSYNIGLSTCFTDLSPLLRY
jgi:hypothetical protein